MHYIFVSILFIDRFKLNNLKHLTMKKIGIILIVVGILMMVFTGFSFEKQEKVVDIGNLEINKTEDKHVGWSTYAGGAVLVVGVVLTAVGVKNNK